MINRNSAIKEKYNIGKYPFEDNIKIIFSENRNLIIQQIAAWPDEISNIEKFFSDQLGVQKKIDFNKGEILKDNSCIPENEFRSLCENLQEILL